MIKFILYDDQKETLKKTSAIIHRLMMKYDFDYRVEQFTNYNKDLEQIIKTKDCLKVYLLDIEVPNVNGVSLASKIRKYDWNSVIIFLTAHDKYKASIFEGRLMVLDYINKIYKYPKRLEETLKLSVKMLKKSSNTLVYKFNSIVYRLPIDDILYIVKVPENKKCEIHTISGNIYEIGGSISKLCKTLKRNFRQSHKSCIVNADNIKTIDSSNNVITFKNGKSIYLLSNRMKKNFKEFILNYK